MASIRKEGPCLGLTVFSPTLLGELSGQKPQPLLRFQETGWGHVTPPLLPLISVLWVFGGGDLSQQNLGESLATHSFYNLVLRNRTRCTRGSPLRTS